jgi:hypothetical protein
MTLHRYRLALIRVNILRDPCSLSDVETACSYSSTSSSRTGSCALRRLITWALSGLLLIPGRDAHGSME